MLNFIKVTAAAGFLVTAVAGLHAQVTVANIEGPIPVTAASGEPYRGANEQPVAGPGLPIPSLIPFGYVEEEYFVSGTVDGKPYKTSLLVRKPKDPAKFSGLVAFETIHAQGAIPMWGARPIWLPGGHAWAAVASQRVALEAHARKANPKRYESLQVPEAPAAPGAAPGAAAGPMGGGGQDAISQEIVTQVGALLKSNTANGPFRGLTVRYLILGGSSQTGGTTIRYIQNSHEKARMPDGKYIWDGYLPQLSFSATPISAKGVPIMHMVTEGDLMNTLGAKRPLGQRPDSDAPDDRYRHYQYAGGSHVGMRGIKDPLQVFSTLGGAFKPGEKLSQYPMSEFFAPAIQHLVAWVMKGTAPPKAEPITLANGEIVRDEHGNAKGGVRSPYVDTPTVRYLATAPMAQGDNPARRLIGLEEAFPAEKLRSLYKTKANYLRLFDQGIDRMVAGRWLSAADGKKLKDEEAARDLPF